MKYFWPTLCSKSKYYQPYLIRLELAGIAAYHHSRSFNPPRGWVNPNKLFRGGRVEIRLITTQKNICEPLSKERDYDLAKEWLYYFNQKKYF